MNRTTGVVAPLSPLLMRGNEPRSTESVGDTTSRCSTAAAPANLINWASTPATTLAFIHTLTKGEED